MRYFVCHALQVRPYVAAPRRTCAGACVLSLCVQPPRVASRSLQLPPEAWLRLSLPHASITHLVFRPNGEVSLRMLGDAGHLPPEMVTF